MPDEHDYLAATLPVYDLAAGSVAALAAAANRYRRAVELDPVEHRPRPDRIAASFRSVLRIDGTPVPGFAELSGFFPTADGLIRTHANYPHHRTRLLELLELPDDTDRARFADAARSASADDLEHRAADAGALVFRVRTERQWRTSEVGAAAAAEPLVAVTVRNDHRSGGPSRTEPTVAAPLAGLRVLDLTRVLAGPVATRALALLGAEVLRIDPPDPAEIVWQHQETGQGKRSAVHDLRSDPDTLAELMRTADVLVTGYRPGSLPITVGGGVVRGAVTAWGGRGPWRERRGFDSLVQAVSGIALIEGDPGALPAQALDHASGYLLAAGIVDALAARIADGTGRDVAVSLARTATELLDTPGRTPDHRTAREPGPDTLVTHGRVSSARPVLTEYDDYPFPARAYGGDRPEWLSPTRA